MIKVDIEYRPDWWIKIVQDYENNVLGGVDADYPDRDTYVKDLKNRYNFYIEPKELSYIEFENDKDYTMFLLKWR